MSLPPGTRIGPHEIEGVLGSGGMGEVYRARDTRLGRSVAIKALPDVFAADPERVARFAREAQVLASLNHPHIATIYGLEEARGATFIVLELVEGRSLAEMIASPDGAPALPVDESLRIARQIADALEAAHARGIVHRDLKPANIVVTPDGRVKVLDFGLAKTLETDPSVDPNTSPTLTGAPTQAGLILGTAGYMAPEQAKGLPADKRSDVWALGCVLYEMLTGRRAFAGEGSSETIAAVLRGEPDWTALPAGLPAMVGVYLRRCLRKNPKERVQDIGDMRLALEGAFDPPSGPPAPASATRRRPAWARAAVLALPAIGLLLVGAALASWLRPAASSAPVRRFALSAAPATLAIATTNRDVLLTPDGTRVVYFASQAGSRQMYVRPLDSLTGVPLRAAEQWFEPFVSPDSRWVGFIDEADYVMRKISLAGGPPVTIAPLGVELMGAVWGPDDTIVFAKREDGAGLWRVPAAGGTPVALTTLDASRGEVRHVWPEILPNGRAVLFTIQSGSGGDESEIAVLDLATDTRRTLVPGTNPRFAASGHLLYVVEGTLHAVRFDPDRLEIRGEPVPVLEQVLTKSSGGADFSLSTDGALLYVSGTGSSMRRRLAWVGRDGARQRIDAPVRAYAMARISPDGLRVVLDIRDQDSDLWSWDISRQTLSRMTTERGFDGNPVWSPDGQRIIFASTRAGLVNAYAMAADGSGVVERLIETPFADQPSSISPDGTRVVIRRDTSTTGQDLMMLLLDGPPRLMPLLASKFNERNGEVSPDGKWLAYDSNESGPYEVYVRPFPNVDGGRWQISSGGGRQPVWVRGGRELVYAENTSRLMSATIEDAPSFKAGAPRVVAEAARFAGPTARAFDVSPDGQRFLIIEDTDAGAAGSTDNIIVVLNWTEELKRVLPPAR